MVRPSHYLVFFTVIFLVVAWGLGADGLGSGVADAVPGDRATGPRPWIPQKVSTKVVGRILDRAGWPISGATVRVGDATEVFTDTAGAFELPVRGPLAVDLEASAPDHQAVWEQVHPAAGDRVVLVLGDEVPWETPEGPEPRPGATMLAGDGFLQDVEGDPVAGAVVIVRETGALVRTDEVGHYTVPLPHETASLVAYADNGLVARSEPYNPPARQGLTPMPPMVMVPGSTLRGVLRDPDGGPLAGAALILEGDGARRRVETGEGGWFQVRALLEGDYQLTALPFRGLLGFRLPVRLPGTDVDLQDLALLREEPMRIQVIGEGGDPRPKAHVLAEDSGLRRAHAQADDLGWVTLLGLAGGGFSFEVRTPEELRVLTVVRRDGDQLIVADE